MGNAVTESVGKAKQLLRVVAKRRWLALGVAAAAAALCAAGVVLVPSRYEAKAQIYVDTQSVLKPMMAELTYQPDIDVQVRMLARTLVSRPNVEKLVRNPALGLDTADAAAHEKLVTRLMQKIKVEPAAAANLYDISFRGESPEVAQRLVQVMVQMFADASSGAKRRDAQDAGRFIEEQIRSYEATLVEAENRLKDFKVRNFGVTGVSSQDYYTRVSALTDAVTKLRTELSAAEQARDAYRRELAAEDPQLPAELAPRAGSPAALEAETRLDAQKKNLDELLRRFTEAHPDVISARRVIAELEAEEKQRKEAEARLPGKPGKAATSPVYQKLRVSLAEAEAQVASLRAQLSMQQAELDQTRGSGSQRPQVEAELAQLNRDYEVIRKNYDAMVARREAATLGARLDSGSHYAEFRVIEPARASDKAVFPNRLHLALMSIAASLLAGAGAALFADSLRPAFEEAEPLEQLSGRPVIGTVSKLVTPQGVRERHARHMRFGAALGSLLLLQAAWVVWIAISSKVL
ncbi:MAG TPA: Wzz/FepE/Etk N-terminal domain-containing protein [Rubrivivax sp.]|nr:Wzz/FepE/Etk N-terminal domain-containing protein [Rubrivivax sp.]